LGNYLYANEAFIDAFGLDPDNYEGKSDFELFPENCARSNWANDLEAIRNQQVVESETQFIRDGKVYIYRHVHQVLKDYKGKPNLIISEAEDITSRKQAEEKLTIAARVFQQAGEAIVVTDRNGRIQSINEAFSKLSGYSEQEANGEEIGKLLNSRRHSDDFFADMWHHLIERGHWQGEVWNRRKNGDVVSEWLTINSISNADNETECYISVFSDITSLKESQRKVEFLATHDALSGLPNRNLFMDRLDNALTRCRRNRSSLAVMFIDLDGFKTINDTLGHDIGDQLLIQVARKLQTLVRDIDTVSRLGGDEFTIALSECNPEEVQLIANRILDELSHPVEIEERKIFASASIGIALYPEDGSDSSGLLKAADTAMYKSKELGRNQYQFFHPNMRERLLKQSAMDNSIKKAIRLKQFRLVFQPKFSTAAPATMIGAEALLRWNQPELGEIPPAEFIPVAERNGSIIELSNLIIALLIEQLARLRSTGLVLPEIAFNVSARSFQQEAFVSSLSKTMQTYMLPPEQLKIEITEGAVMENNPTAIDNLEALRELGMGIAIDDFGTGYSSLSYLKQLPIDELKIDKSFVDGVGQDDNDEAISKAILSMAAALDLDVVAEGVETQAQLTWLQNNGCPMVQGYLLSPPLELEEFAERVLQQQMVSAKDDTNMGDTNTESTND
ncbi:MAG: EAL domain-containing protein, partial [Cellvibrionaceae bacterium]|nr:EAL domain-containing protein [Cellvibrionaceae bacterium]